MRVNPSISHSGVAHLPPSQAAALWSFVSTASPRFTLQSASQVIAELNLRPGEDLKVQARRLTEALKPHSISLKHTSALKAISLLRGASSWFAEKDALPARLRMLALDTDKFKESEFRSWPDLAKALRDWADLLYARGQLPLNVLTISLTMEALQFSTPVPPEEGQTGGNQSWPLATITPLEDFDNWLTGMPAAIEKFRKHIEDTTGRAILDGAAVIQFCAKQKGLPGHGTETINDIPNAELVLMREDNEDDPHGAYEVARGDELTCWHQFELSLQDDKSGQRPSAHVSVPEEGVGAWIVDGKRFVWMLETLRPNEYVPGLIKHLLGPRECEKLRRRYVTAKRIHGATFKHHDLTKRVAYLAGPPETYRVDLHYLLHQLNKAELTWESYFERFDVGPTPMQAELPIGFALELIKNLKLENPNRLFAKPTIAEMAIVEDDSLLRTLMPRVDSVRYTRPRDLDETTSEALHEIVDNFASALHMQKMVSAGGIQMESELPYLLYASDALEFQAGIDELGLSMYVGVIPNLFEIPKHLLLESVETWPWALGHALYFRFERADR